MMGRKTKRIAEAGRAPRRASLAAAIRASKKTSAIKPTLATGKPGRDDLRRQLDMAEARVKLLEGRLAAVTDRIAWIADRLHSLLEDRE